MVDFLTKTYSRFDYCIREKNISKMVLFLPVEVEVGEEFRQEGVGTGGYGA